MEVKEIWNKYADKKNIRDSSRVLFESDNNLTVSTIEVGENTVLKRTREVDDLIMSCSQTVMADFQKELNNTEGIIYLMFKEEGDEIIPLYVGISEKIGRSGKLSSLFNGKTKKPRWDYYDGYHIGDLSTVVCEGYEDKAIKKSKVIWADSLFKEFPSESPALKYELKLWYHVWKTDSQSIFRDLGHSSLPLEEALLIEILEKLYPGSLLNVQGKLR